MNGLPKILIVDDEDFLRESLSSFFIKRGYSVKVAENGEVALDIFKRFIPDIVISDVRMPIVDGPTFMKSAYNYNKNLYSCFVTGHSDLSDKELLSIGVKKVFHKPLSKRDLLSFVEACRENKYE